MTPLGRVVQHGVVGYRPRRDLILVYGSAVEVLLILASLYALGRWLWEL